MPADPTPTPADLALDLSTVLEWAVRLPQHPYPTLAVAIRRAIASEAILRRMIAVVFDDPPTLFDLLLLASKAKAMLGKSTS